MDYFKRGRCGIDNCRSKLYYSEDGLTFCKNGHQHDELRQTQQDEDDFGSQGRKTRKRKEVVEEVSRIYFGQSAFELYLQCYQLILWKQCHVLVHKKSFLPQLETVVHDLWALRLQLLKSRPGDISDTDDEPRVFSSQAEQSDTENDQYSAGGHERRAKKLTPNLIETLGLCYLGAVLLKVPFSIGELYEWALREDIPYIRAVRMVPRSMKQRLPSHYLALLDTLFPLTTDTLHDCIQQLVVLYNGRFDLQLPALNYTPILFKFIRNLALPLEVFNGVQQVARLLSFSFTFPKPSIRQHVWSLPEIRLVALLVAVTKLYYPFDSLKRYSKSSSEIGYLTVDWEKWCNVEQSHDKGDDQKRSYDSDNDIMITEDDVFDLSDTQIDKYLDWYERMWVDEERKYSPTHRGIPQQLLDMFPTDRLGDSEYRRIDDHKNIEKEQNVVSAKLISVQENLKMKGIVSEVQEGDQETPIHRVGSFYKRYRQEEDLPAHAKAFYTAVARMAGLSLSRLIKAVFSTEIALSRWKENKDSLEDTGQGREVYAFLGKVDNQLDDLDQEDSGHDRDTVDSLKTVESE